MIHAVSLIKLSLSILPVIALDKPITAKNDNGLKMFKGINASYDQNRKACLINCRHN
jgi:hypothetical protein